MSEGLDLDLPTASKDPLFFDPNMYPICEQFMIEQWIYIKWWCT
ncbi:2092_t:CDS:2 [Dentiscutata erythropus]|uniref:2092_t:CDS:1 n=1 Tax=Dentiscutata erythropus TaxID=1348616 RepID=A0A9N8ZHD0_9GLOM|nr:2092_t:CDS:2 [Dentiscutata erythropus]